jgi:hypothetical protein
MRRGEDRTGEFAMGLGADAFDDVSVGNGALRLWGITQEPKKISRASLISQINP